MSTVTAAPARRVTIQTLARHKAEGRRVVALTCYDYSTARVLDETDVDVLLVGDSLAMTLLGHPDTLSLSVEEMLHHVRAVTRGAQRALVVADMPFLSYQISPAQALENAGRLVRDGRAAAVKVEGASPRVLAAIEALVEVGIPVMGHVGLTPQSVHALGGFRMQGKTPEQAEAVLQAARRVEAAGAFSVVLEVIPPDLAAEITGQLTIPTIGIGAGPHCDGQILVTDDLLGRYPGHRPKFVVPYAEVADLTREAVSAYCQDVLAGRYPA